MYRVRGYEGEAGLTAVMACRNGGGGVRKREAWTTVLLPAGRASLIHTRLRDVLARIVMLAGVQGDSCTLPFCPHQPLHPRSLV